MKRKTIKVLSVCLALVLALSGLLCVSAAKYATNVISKTSDYNKFVQPGDIDENGKFDNADVVGLKAVLLNKTSATNPDVNGDGDTDICDLVKQGEQPDAFVEGTTIHLKGKSFYNGELKLTSGAQYKISGAGGVEITLKINGVATSIDGDGVFTTPKTITSTELIIKGDVDINNFKLARINMDNDAEVA